MFTIKTKAIVVGGGLGGISAAITLAKEGFDVELFEANEHIGGKVNLLQRDGFSFDLGPSIFTMPHIFQELFEGSGEKQEDYFALKRIDLEWRNFFPSGQVLDLYGEQEKTVAHNSFLGEKDLEELKSFEAYSQRMYEVVNEGYFDKGLDTWREIKEYYGMSRLLTRFDIFSTMDRGVARRINNPYLREVLNFFIKYVGSSPYDAPSIMNLLPYIQWAFGLWYVEGGMMNLGWGLEKLARKLGVKIHLGQEVTKIHHRDDRVTGVQLSNGEEVAGDVIISNMEVLPTYRELLDVKPADLQDLKRFEPACSGLVLHLGVKGSYPQLAHHNFFFSGDSKEHFDSVFHKKELPQDPTIYLVAPVQSDETIAPPGHEIIKILPHIPPVQEEPFPQEAYLELRERVLNKLEAMGLENLQERTVVEEMWTPHDIQRLYRSNRGAIYGVVAHRTMNLGFKAPKQSNRYRNLLFTGGSVNPGGGMPMAVLSGIKVVDRVLQAQGG